MCEYFEIFQCCTRVMAFNMSIDVTEEWKFSAHKNRIHFLQNRCHHEFYIETLLIPISQHVFDIRNRIEELFIAILYFNISIYCDFIYIITVSSQHRKGAWHCHFTPWHFYQHVISICNIVWTCFWLLFFWHLRHMMYVV